MDDPLDRLVGALVAAAGQQAESAVRRELQAAATRLRQAAVAEVETAAREWRAAVTAAAQQAGRDVQDLLRDALQLPQLPGLSDGVPAALVDGAPRLLGGWRPGAPLGPLVVQASHTAVTTAVTSAGAAAAAQAKHQLVGLLPAEGLLGALDLGPAKATGGLTVDRVARTATAHLGFSAGAVAAGALGLLADTDQGLTFLAVVGARFQPGIQLGFGFEISSLGGAFGVNVGVDSEALRRRLQSGTALALFFPAAATSKTDLLPAARETFVPRAGSVVLGPAAELTWLQVAGASALRLSLVLLLELPRGRVLLLGRGALAIPPMLSLRLDLLGEIDVPRGYYAADLAVVDGRVMGIFRAAGTAAMRLSTGTPAYVLLSVGGFYPGYRVEVPGLPPQRRVSFGPTLPLPLSLRFEGYLAFTGDTFQAGARFEIGFDVGVLAAHGFLSFDVLAQLDPFHVHAQLSGGVSVEALGIDFAGVDFHGTLDGPGPVVIAGRVQVSFLGAKARWNDRFVLGDHDRPPPPPALDDLAAEVVATITPASVTGEGGTDPHVRTTAPERDAAGRAVVHPMGHVRWSQTLVPLEEPLQRAAGRRLAGPRRVTVLDLVGGTTSGVTERFAPGSFRDADKDALLSLPAFEALPSGARVLLEPRAGGQTRGTLAYEEVYRRDPQRAPALMPLLVPLAVGARLAAQRDAAAVRLSSPRVTVTAEGWSVRSATEPALQEQPLSRTSAVTRAQSARRAGTDEVALPLSEPAHSAAGIWEAP